MKFTSKTKKSALPTDKISRTAQAKDTVAEASATSGQPASTPTAVARVEAPAAINSPGGEATGESPADKVKPVGVILKEEPAATVTAARQGGASWFIPAQKPSGFGGK